MKKIFNREVIIGLCVIAALAILFLGIDFLKGVNVFKPSNYYYATYTNVEGLAVSAPVTVNGFKVGLVRSIDYEYNNPGHVRVEMSLDSHLKVPEGSEAILGSDLLGTASIALKLAPSNLYHNIGDELIGKNASGMMDALSNELLPSVYKIMPQVDSLLLNVNKIVGEPALIESMKNLEQISAQLELTARNLALASGKIGPVVNNVDAITSNVADITGDFSTLSAQLKELPVDSLIADIKVTSDNLKSLSTQLNDPNSTLGLLMHSPELYENLNATVQSLDSLFVDIKRNPKRYVTIKVF